MKEVITMMIITIIIMDPYKKHFYILASEHRNIFCDTTVHTKGSKTCYSSA